MSCRILRYIWVAWLILIPLAFLGYSQPWELETLWAGSEERGFEYFCPMHPQVVSDKPGKCPICGMPLSKRPKGAVKAPAEAGPEVSIVQFSPGQVKLAGVKKEPAAYRSLTKEIYTVGRVTYDERRLAYATARIMGRVDKLFVDFTGTEVEQGAPLVWIYSPDLVSTQKEYLLALETVEKMKGSSTIEVVKGAESLLKASRDRLLLWGITEEQVEELTKTREVKTHMVVYSPITGTVIKKDVLVGQYVMEGAQMYTIADLSNLWMMADVYEFEMALVKLGQKVEIASPTYPGQAFVGMVSFIDPFLNEQTRSVKVRVDVPNPESKLKPAMFVNATIKIPLGSEETEEITYYCPMHPEVVSNKPGVCEKCGGMPLMERPQGVLAIPRSAVLDTGLRKIVYVEREENLFVAREIKTGFEAEGFIQVLEGLKEGERVASAGAFLIDAETKLGPGVAAQYYGATGGPTEEAAPPPHVHGTPAEKLPPPEKGVERLPEVEKAPSVEEGVLPMVRMPAEGEAIDPVCGMDVKPAEALSLKYEEGIYYFCSQECLTHFQSNPGLFSARVWVYKEAGATDLVCGATLEKAKADKYRYKGETYYFCCDECKRRFKKNPDKYFRSLGEPAGSKE